MDSVHEFEFDSGRLSLDFANTAEWHASQQPTERLTGYGQLVEWGLQAGLLSAEEAGVLRQRAAQAPARAKRVLRAAVALRESIYRVFSATAGDERPPASDLQLLADNLRRAIAGGKLAPSGATYDWSWSSEDLSLSQVLWPVVNDAVDLLRADALDRVGECADDRGCGWLFFDTSRNHSRRWCSMDSCGNRAKARRHYQRIKAEAGG
jgi:predicted RNA-binding Zn ribbon-like protein